MKYKIRYRKYDKRALVESVSVIEAWFFKIRKKFVVIWFEDNDTQAPDFYINVDDVLTIERIEDEEK